MIIIFVIYQHSNIKDHPEEVELPDEIDDRSAGTLVVPKSSPDPPTLNST